MRTVNHALLLFSFIFSAHALAVSDGFDVEKLPIGSDVTIPNPAITYVPITTRVTLSSTDLPQTVKMSSVNTASGKAVPLRVAIYDRLSPRVKYLTVRPGMSYLYSFKGLGSINIVPETTKLRGSLSQYGLRLESDKPLGISR